VFPDEGGVHEVDDDPKEQEDAADKICLAAKVYDSCNQQGIVDAHYDEPDESFLFSC
jgi:hypothetical protein